MADIETRLFINNEYIPSTTGATMTATNPYDGSTVSNTISVATPADIDLAVSAAHAAFTTGPWASFTARQRSNAMLKFADLVEANAATLGRLETLCSGVPIAATTHRFIPLLAELFRYYAGLADKLVGETYGAPRTGASGYGVLRVQPVGVVAAVAAWNASHLYAGAKIAPALAAGCTVVFKPSEIAPLGCLALGRYVVEAGFPPGVVNFVSGGGETGAALAAHETVRLISFTGSVGIGKKIQEAAARSNLKKCILELGGKGAAVVFGDADVPTAVAGISSSILALTGQTCTASSRLFVHRSLAATLLPALKTAFENAAAGMGPDPLEPTTFFGPLASAGQFARVQSMIAAGHASGAEVLTGGGERLGEKGFYVPPTIFVEPKGARGESVVEREEVFGPVLVVRVFDGDDEEEVLRWVNDTEYGLSASVYTRDVSRALRVADAIEAGSVLVNQGFSPSAEMPVGGWKQSGQGVELGIGGLHQYLQTKAVSIKL